MHTFSSLSTTQGRDLQTYLDGLAPASRPTYESRIKDFSAYIEEDNARPLDDLIVTYFSRLRKTYSTSTLWTQYSVIKTYLNLTRKYDIKKEVPQLPKLLKQWQKKEEKKKSSVFSKDQVESFLATAPNDPAQTTMRAVLSVGICGLMRTAELLELTFERVEEQKLDTSGDVQFKIFVNRKKQVGPRALSSFVVTNKQFTQAIKHYIDRFPEKVNTTLRCV
jgi:site-specific recombinase XerD